MAPAVNATTPSARRLSDAMAQTWRALARAASQARDGAPRGVHRARVASRRLREALPIAAAVADRDEVARLRRDVRRLTRALGGVRELDVTLALLDEEAARYRWNAAVVADVRRYLAVERRRRRRRLLPRLARHELARLRGEVRAVVASVAAAPDAEWQRALGRRLERRARTLARACAEVGPLFVPERLHAVRIAGKKCRYTVELVERAAGRKASRLLRALRGAQDRLGRLHDLVVLGDAIRAAMAAPGRGRAAQAPHVGAMLAACDAECRALHADFLATAATLAAQALGTSRALAIDLAGARRMLRIVAPASGAAGHRARRAYGAGRAQAV